MKFILLGQLKGPECRKVMTQAVGLRKDLEPLFENCVSETVAQLTVVLRVDGSLGSFGGEGVENIEFKNGHASCDLVVKNHDWAGRSELEIMAIMKNVLKDAITDAVVSCDASLDIKDIVEFLSNS